MYVCMRALRDRVIEGWMDGWMEGWMYICYVCVCVSICVYVCPSIHPYVPTVVRVYGGMDYVCASAGLHRGRSWSRCWGLAQQKAMKSWTVPGDPLKIHWGNRSLSPSSKCDQNHRIPRASGRSVATWYNSSLRIFGKGCREKGSKVTKNDCKREV